MKGIKVTLHQQDNKGHYCLGINTEGHAAFSTFNYAALPGNAVTVDFFDMTAEDLHNLRDKITEAMESMATQLATV